MFRFSVLGWLKSGQQQARASRRHRRRGNPTLPTRRTVLRVEALEDRALPSTLTVTNLSDSGVSGDGSLRGEIAAAAAGDTIAFQQGLSGTITLGGSQLLISKNLTITGPGASSLTISGNSASRVFDVSNNATVTLSGLTIANGSVIGDENATFGGGGIFNEAGSTLTLSQDTLTGNKATAASSTVDVFGGGLLNQGSATVSSCIFSGNEALGGGGSSFFGGSVGGAIDNFGGATLTVSSSTFTDNQALGAGSGSFGIGGAIENNAGLNNTNPSQSGTNPSTAILSNCVFTSNVASAMSGASGNGVYGNGGALDNEGPGAMMIVSGCGFLHNQSVAGSGSDSANGIGGAIMNYDNSTVTVTNSLFNRNEALGNGSGGSGQGGAIANDGVGASTASTTVSISNCTFSENVAGAGAGGYGGALINNGTYGFLPVIDSTIAANSAASNGGGIMNVGGGFVALNGTIVANSTSGGDTYQDSGQGSAFLGSGDLIGDGSNLSGLTLSLSGNPLLGPLQNNGGPTQTMALMPGSPAIGAGTAITGITTDQRGFSRPTSNPDIGAFQTPVLTSSTASVAINATSLTINGFGFDTNAANDTVSFSGGATGTVAAATPTQLTVGSLNGLTLGSLNASVSVEGVSSGSAVQVATIVLNSQELAVRALYLAALGRPGSHEELDGWVALLPPDATALSQTVAAGIEGSSEARDHLVKSWYVAFLGRPAQGGEEQGWVNALLQGQSEEQVLSQILASQEFYGQRAQTLGFGGTADQNYVRALYQLLLGRAAGDGEVAYWVDVLATQGRQGVALGFLGSQEFRTDQFEGYYDALLHRPSDPGGLSGWVNSGVDLLGVRIGFESSPEFFTNG
jgi:hypothetical protein